MASISGSVTIAGDPDDWIACAFDADTHAFAGVATVSAGAYEITGLTSGKAYVVSCRPKTGPAWAASTNRTSGALVVPTDPEATPYIYRAEPADPYGNDVSLLLNFNGDNNSTTFTDRSNNAFSVSRIGTPVISTTQSQYGGASCYFDGDTDYLRIADNDKFSLGSSNFTIEAWVYRSGGSSEKTICGQWTDSNQLGWLITLNSSNNLTLYYSTNGSSGIFSNYTAGYSVGATTWTHIAACRAGNTLKLFIDGTARYTNSSFTDTIFNASTLLTIGGASSSNYLQGYIDDLRITKGAARYTSDFTPPGAELALNLNGSSEPTWPTTPGNTVVDGDITWTNMGQLVQPLMQGPLIAA